MTALRQRPDKQAKDKSEKSSQSKEKTEKSSQSKSKAEEEKRKFFRSSGKRPESTANDSLLNHGAWSKLVFVLGICTVAYFSANTEKRTFLAKQSDTLAEKRFQNLMCAPAYKREIEAIPNKACVPAKCGRFVLDEIVSPEESHRILQVAKKGLSKGGSSGGASILDLHSGALSKGENFIQIYKSHPELFSAADYDIYRVLKNRVKSTVAAHFRIADDSLYLTHPTFFSRITDQPAKTVHDEYWHLHIDKETYPNFHYTSLLYLSNLGEDFQGGTFTFVDSQDNLNRTIEPKVGRLSAFTSGIENKHLVDPVTKGVRFALTMGFTCDPKKSIPDPGSNHDE